MHAHFPATRFTALAVSRPGDLVFGRAPKPVRCGFDPTLGGGQVYPEVNFTLPAITISEASWAEVSPNLTCWVGGCWRDTEAFVLLALLE
jgi:methanol--5-hydroxybenzimidazolylcobamide Co-methyltransferase